MPKTAEALRGQQQPPCVTTGELSRMTRRISVAGRRPGSVGDIPPWPLPTGADEPLEAASASESVHQDGVASRDTRHGTAARLGGSELGQAIEVIFPCRDTKFASATWRKRGREEKKGKEERKKTAKHGARCALKVGGR
ncbi:hypothetical protein THAOC_27403 [Thalassiosira oceanica]|uniref:Uncharacterized protein n=1 Tax=Thalassiosira oceanica TaxID=159749 RepID=K0S2Y2_THAOC|nr:hypothetical protein THAOC_27403 [Thalassiosira oceanica]|eukprot:EJK53212.1 hypothetical protein THAOC_27403 [Thalassiosira oceanica]